MELSLDHYFDRNFSFVNTFIKRGLLHKYYYLQVLEKLNQRVVQTKVKTNNNGILPYVLVVVCLFL